MAAVPRSVCCGIALLSVIGGSALAADRTQTLRFKPGASSANFAASLTGADKVSYKFNASKSQTMTVTFTPQHRNCYMTVAGPASKDIFDGTMDGHDFSGKAPASGAYTIRLFLIGPAAERGDICAYGLEVKLSR